MDADVTEGGGCTAGAADDGFPFGVVDEEPSGFRSSLGLVAPSTALEPRDTRRDLAGRRSTSTYVKRVFTHPGHLTALTAAVVISLVHWSPWILLGTVVVELVVLGFLPMLRLFRDHVDASLDEARCAQAMKAREAMIARLGERHRGEIGTIDRLVQRTRESDRERGVEVRSMLDDGLCRLSLSYIRLALAHRACEEALATTNPLAIEETIRTLDGAHPGASDSLRPVIERRLAIAHRRLAYCARTRESLEFIGHQLATILDLVQLMYQQAIAPVSSSDPHEIDRFLSELEASELAMKEVGGLDDALSSIP